MICARCGNETDSNDCAECGKSALLDGRYRLDEVIGQRGSHKTYRALDVDRQRQVVVKELLLRAATSAKDIELFQREAELLVQLDHAGVPAFVDHFELRLGKQLGLFVVQQYVDGESLEAIIARERLTESDVAKILAEVLRILTHLESRGVVHRDLKPSNILRDEAGQLHLVDFGAGRAVAESIYRAGSTVTGTFGYMAPEQMRAEAVPASDVYGLGATAVRLLTRREPSELVGEDASIQWRDRGTFDAGLAGLIDTMLSRSSDDRPSDLLRIADELEAFARGDARALRAHVSQGALVARGETAIARPGIAPLARDFTVHALPMLTLGMTLVGAAGAGLSAAGSEVAVLFALAIALGATLLVLGGRRTWLMLERSRIFRDGVATRAVVCARHVHEGDFFVEYEFRVEDERRRAFQPVTETVYMELHAGDEIDVFVRGSGKHRSAMVESGRYSPSLDELPRRPYFM